MPAGVQWHLSGFVPLLEIVIKTVVVTTAISVGYKSTADTNCPSVLLVSLFTIGSFLFPAQQTYFLKGETNSKLFTLSPHSSLVLAKIVQLCYKCYKN